MNKDQNKGSSNGFELLLSGSFIVAVALALSAISQFAFLIVIAHRIGASGVGLISMTLRTISLFQMIAVFGTPAVITRMVAATNSTDERRWILPTALVLTIPVSILMELILFLISAPLSIATNMPELPWLLFLYSMSLPFTTVTSITSSYFRGGLRFLLYAFLIASPSIISLVLSLFWFNSLNSTLAISAILMGSIFSGTIGLGLTRLHLWNKPVLTNARKLTYLSLPLLIVGFSGTFIDSIDIIVLGIISGSTDVVGIYSNAFYLSTYLRYVIEPFALVLLPLVSISLSSHNYKDARQVINISVRIIVIFFSSIAVTVSVASHEILSRLLPPIFSLGASSLSILAVGSIGLSFYYLFSRVMIADEKTMQLGVLLVIVAIVDFFLTVLLTNIFRIEGTALSTGITFMTMGLASVLYVQYQMDIKIQIGFIDIARFFMLYVLCYFLKLVLVSVSAIFGIFLETIVILLVLTMSIVFWILVKPFSEEESNYIISLIASTHSLNRFENILTIFVRKMSRRNK